MSLFFVLKKWIYRLKEADFCPRFFYFVVFLKQKNRGEKFSFQTLKPILPLYFSPSF